MWQRRGNNAPTISQPTQFTRLDQDNYYDYDYDERYLETIHEVESISSRRQSAMVLPDLPFRTVPPMTDIPQPVNLHAQKSSSTNIPQQRGLRINVHAEGDPPTRDEVSPLTPQYAHPSSHSYDEPPVSPIESLVPATIQSTGPQRPFQSQIPRKKVKSPENHTNETKWDEYSGEPTTDDRGKPASVRPGVAPLEMQYPHLKERTKQILAGLREREAAKSVPWGRVPSPVAAVDPLDEPPQREPWRGASGRAAIVEPVRNTPSARQGPLLYTERKSSQPRVVQAPVTQDTPQLPTRSANRPQAVQSPTEPTTKVVLLPSPALRSVSSEDEIKPVAPLKPGKRIRTPELVTKAPVYTAVTQSPPVSPEPLLQYQEQLPEVVHPRVESPQYDEEPRTPTTPIASDNPPPMMDKDDTPSTYGPADFDREQSRFSWTTYTTTANESPRSLAQVVRDSSPPPPIPELPPAITIKKRPVSTSPFMHSSPSNRQSYADSSASIIRKPVPGFAPRVSSLSTATSRAMSTSKSLPPTPTILEASDKIENLDAQLEALNHRKHNISRIVADLERSLKKNAVVYDMWKRKEVEKNIINHKLELDDVGREIHEISIRLHRTQKKRDIEDGYEVCTGLWIKRVTS